jgi:hypothetical protein
MASFNINRDQPAAPVPRQLRHVVADTLAGRINTNTRYGRKQQWKIDQSMVYIKALLDANHHVDPISLSVHGAGNTRRENAVNGNNRLRSIVAYVNNKWGVDAIGTDGRVYTWYYSIIPQSELDRPSRRARCKVLSEAARGNFDDFPLLLNVRFGLTEAEEIAWYRALNRNVSAHSKGQLLAAAICDPMSPFAHHMLETFPAMKARVQEPATDADVNSLGVAISDATGVEFDAMHHDDIKENTLVAQAVVFNLLVNGTSYDDEFKGHVLPVKLSTAANKMKEVFTRANLSDSLKAEMASPVHTKPYMKTLCLPGYLLGPIAWSMATEKPLAVEVWTRFLDTASAGTIDAVYMREIITMNLHDKQVKKYSTAWERVVAHVDAQNQ